MIKYLLLFISLNVCSQTRTVTGVVFDENEKPLESANIIAKPLQEKASIKFAIADNKGRYKLELDQLVKYEITVSYIGHIEESFIIEANSSINIHNFKLKSTGETLKEIVIKHEYSAIEIKKDTLTYDVKAFANGNERKLKELLEKLPGVEVDKKGNVRVQGKKVTQMLVEGKSFFGGGSKLAVENIPADALDKIEVIDHFNEVGFMKQVSDSDELAMNVKLKENKKRFIFGDIETAAEVANDNGFYLAHASLFYYAPKTNISCIADANTIGKSTFTFEDLLRFQGGVSSYLSDRKSLTNLYSFTNDNSDVIQNKSQFGALNFSFDTSSKLSISGYGLFSKVIMQSLTENKNEYLQNSSISNENKTQDNKSKSVLGIGNVKFDYAPNNKEKWFYNSQFQSSTNNINNLIQSITNLNTNTFETLSKADNSNWKQYLEWHKNYNEHHTTTFVVNQALENNTPQNHWYTNQAFLIGMIPLQNDSSYTIEQIKKVKNNTIDALFKYYWVINNSNHLYLNIGNNYIQSRYETAEKQLLTDGSENNFGTNGFGNQVKYQLNDAYLGLEYKFKFGKWTNKAGLFWHNYHLNTNQNASDFTILKKLIQPQFNSDYEFNKSEKLSLNYKLSNSFPEVSQMANQYTLQSYNSVFKGNALLQNETYHSANLRYSKMNLYRGMVWNASLNYNKKIKTIRNSIQLNGINQYNTPILTDNPETNWRFNTSISKRIYRFNLKLNTNMSWFNYLQTLNNLLTSNNRNNQNIGLTLKTAFKKWPDISINYQKGFNQFSGITKSNYQTDEYTTEIEWPFLKSFVFTFDYNNLKNTNNSNQTNYYQIANSALRYQKKNSPFGFEVFMNNILDNKLKNSFSFSDYLISETKTYLLPRMIMLSVNYKI